MILYNIINPKLLVLFAVLIHKTLHQVEIQIKLIGFLLVKFVCLTQVTYFCVRVCMLQMMIRWMIF